MTIIDDDFIDDIIRNTKELFIIEKPKNYKWDYEKLKEECIRSIYNNIYIAWYSNSIKLFHNQDK